MTEEHVPRARRRRVITAAAVAGAVLLLGGVAAAALTSRPAGTPGAGGSVTNAAPTTAPRPAPPRVTNLEPLYEALNLALHSQDRTAFLAHVGGAATEPLTLWWDNMDALGWSTGAISPTSDGAVDVAGDMATIEVLLGTDMGFPQRHPPADGSDEPGGVYTLGYPYEVTVDLTGAEPVVVGWQPLYGTRPWDASPLTVVRAEGVVVSGAAEEATYLKRTARAAQVASAWTRSDYERQHGRQPVEGFVVFATEDRARFLSWYENLAGETWAADPLGFAFSGYLPARGIPGVDESLATGDNPSGGLVSIGPDAATGPEGLEIVLVHEFAHVLQLIDNPTRSMSTPLMTDEGWAVYQELTFLHDGTFPLDGPITADLRACVGDRTPVLPTDEDLRGDDAWCAYLLAGTVYAYAASQGIDPEELADVGLRRGVSPFGAAQRLQTPMSGDDWGAWVISTYL